MLKALLLAILPTVIAKFLGLSATPSVRDDEVNLGKAENEQEHQKQDGADRAALNVPPVSGDAGLDRLRDHTG